MKKLILFSIFLPFVCLAQVNVEAESTSYEWLNSPVCFPQTDFVLGINLFASADMPFAVNDVLNKRVDDSLVFSVPKLFANIDERVNFYVNTKSQIFYLGMKLGAKRRNYVSISNDVITYFDLEFNKNVLDYLINGNHKYIGQEVTQNRKGLGFIAYNSLALSFARQVNHKLIIELKAKYLTGLINVQLERFNLNLFSNHPSNGEALFTEMSYDLLVHTSSVDKNGAQDFMSNKGYAFDLGFDYSINEHTHIVGAVNDIGLINWDQSNNQSFKMDSVLRVESLFDPSNEDSDIGEQVQDNLDSLGDHFFTDTLYMAYSTPLPLRMYFGAYFQISEKQNCSLLVHALRQGNTFYNTINLGYELTLTSFLKTQVTYQIIDKSYDNLGLGLAFNLGRFQLDLGASNLFAIDLLSAEKSAYRFGLRYKFNRKEQVIDRKFSDYKNRF